MTEMAILQEIDKCMRCKGCVLACKRTWKMANPTDIETLKPAKSLVSERTRLAIKSQARADMGPFVRFSCWHCTKAPCAAYCPLGAITKEATGAVSVDSAACKPAECNPTNNPYYPCQVGCQRGGYPKVGQAYEGSTTVVMNKCTLCHGRAGAEADVDPNTSLPTRASKVGNDFVSDINGTVVPELAHEPACVSSCPAKAMRWDSKANILEFLEANYVGPDDGRRWQGGGSVYWASNSLTTVAPPKADPFIEDHVTPMVSSLLTGSGKMLLPTLVLGGLAVVSARRTRNEGQNMIAEEV